MTDPLGLIGNVARPDGPLAPGVAGRAGAAGRADDGPGFKALLEKQLAEVNALQKDAKEAAEDAMAGRRDDIEGVILATQKADTAFRLLLQVRNKMMDAYEEIKQVRVSDAHAGERPGGSARGQPGEGGGPAEPAMRP